jgi:hypothetical protein
VTPPPQRWRPARLRTLAELTHLRETMQRREHEAAERAAQERAERLAAERLRRQFADAVGPVTPLPPDGRAPRSLPPPEPTPRQRLLDEQAALREALSDEVDVETLLLTDDGLSFRRPRVGPDVVTRLRRGHWAIRASLTCTACAATKRATRWPASCANRRSAAGVACVWCMARVTARRAANPCSRPRCTAGWGSMGTCWPLHRPARPKAVPAP